MRKNELGGISSAKEKLTVNFKWIVINHLGIPMQYKIKFSEI